jgi:hypothetical protein
MLDLRFKSFYITSSFIGCEKGVDIVKEYDRGFLYRMLLKCYHHLHPMKFLKLDVQSKQLTKIPTSMVFNRLSTQVANERTCHQKVVDF